MVSIYIAKGQGLTQALKSYAQSQNIDTSNITSKDWYNTIEQLRKIQQQRQANNQESIYSGDKMIVHIGPKEFSDDEMDSLFQSMGLSITKANKTESSEAKPEKKEKSKATDHGEYEGYFNDYKEAKSAFEAQKKKDGWAAKFADTISVLWGSKNRATLVDTDLKAYKSKLDKLDAAIEAEDEEKIESICSELDEMNITNRVEEYNDSQDKGGSVVKTGTVALATTAAAVLTGGSSLAAQALVVGGTTAATKFTAETTDLASNDIDGDVSENIGKIAVESAVEGVIAGGLTYGIGKTAQWIKGAKASTSTSLTTTPTTPTAPTAPTTSSSTSTAQKLLTGPSGSTGSTTAGATTAGATKAAGQATKESIGIANGLRKFTSAEKSQLAKALNINVEDLVSITKNDLKKIILKHHTDGRNSNSELFNLANRLIVSIRNKG